MTSKCVRLNELLKVQELIIKRNLKVHKWLRHIPNEEQGAIDFIEHYGFIMREVYCGFACPYRKECEIAKEFLPKEVKSYDATNDPDVLDDLELKGIINV